MKTANNNAAKINNDGSQYRCAAWALCPVKIIPKNKRDLLLCAWEPLNQKPGPAAMKGRGASSRKGMQSAAPGIASPQPKIPGLDAVGVCEH